MSNYFMQGRSGGVGGDGALYVWNTPTPDWTGSDFSGPGDAEDVVILRSPPPSSGGAAAVFGATISPSTITSNQNNYSPTGWDTAGLARLASDASRNLTGLAAPTIDGVTRKIIVNVGSNPIVIQHENSSSTAGNRVNVPGGSDLTLGAGDNLWIVYDATSSRWRVV